MRILLALGEGALLSNGDRLSFPYQHRNIETAAEAVAALADEHELIVFHANDAQIGHMLQLGLRNALPDRDVVSVLIQVVVARDDPAFGGGYGRRIPSPEPHAIAEIRSLRALLGAGALVVCASGSSIPAAMDGLGTLHGVEAVVDKDLTAALLARRLDADLLLMLTDVDATRTASKVEAARRFAETTGRRAAIGALSEATRVVRGEAGTQILHAPEPARP